ncbi:MAG: efflux RND transporter periplasmic adaptor subunit [Pseudomonadota bacterium]|nr:efflux RND transporter periplasmic adaptor subunit [Pseudomonadota bacterium]
MNLRTISLAVVLLLLLLAFAYVATSSGPLAAIPITVTQVKNQAIAPALFGVGVVDARHRYRIGPTITGQVLRLDADVGDRVTAKQLLGEMDPVDMNSKIAAKDAAIKRAKASVVAAQARVNDSAARASYAKSQSQRYEQLAKAHTVSAEVAEAKHQEYQIAEATLAASNANLNATREELEMLLADSRGLIQQRSTLRLMAPVAGLVVGRYVEPGSTAMAGQAVLEIIDPKSIWLNVRFDQRQSSGLAIGQHASIVLRSHPGQALTGQVARIEPLADAVTEEIQAKIIFDQLPATVPPLGELTEITVALPELASVAVVPNASIKQINGETGVWLIENDELRYVPVKIGASDLDGQVQIMQGLTAGDRIVVYSKQALSKHSRIKIVDQLVSETP